MERAQDLIEEFGRKTTLHGICYITRRDLSWTERIIWAFILLMAAALAFYLSAQSLLRFYQNPTVVVIEKNYRDWKIELPAITSGSFYDNLKTIRSKRVNVVTFKSSEFTGLRTTLCLCGNQNGCFIDRTNLTSAEIFIVETWGNTTDDEKYKKYLDFLIAVTNVSYTNLHDFNQFLTQEEFAKLSGRDLVVISRRLMKQMEYFTANDPNMDFFEVVTEMGLCYTYSGNVSYHFTWSDRKPPVYQIKKCDYEAANCGIRMEEFPSSIMIYVHSPYEIPDISSNCFVMDEGLEVEASFRYFEISSASDLQHLRLSQRNCRFADEPSTDDDKFYSYNLCRMNCRKKLLIERCGCSPHFYYSARDKICDVKGLACVFREKEHILKSLKNKSQCDCYPSCKSMEYFLKDQITRRWTYPAPPNIVFRWSIDTYSKIRTKRSIIFGMNDMLVSFGGAASLLFGCSFITIIETFNFFFLYYFWKYLQRILTPHRDSGTTIPFHQQWHE